MHKLSIHEANNVDISTLPFSYFSCAVYLAWAGYTLHRNGENLLLAQDSLYPCEFPSLFLPKKKKNWRHIAVTFAREQDLKKLEAEHIESVVKKSIGHEFIYETQHFINPDKKQRKRIEKFESTHTYKVASVYPKQKIDAFYKQWKKRKKNPSFTFDESESFFYFCLNNLKKCNIQQVYIEIDKKLVGLAWGVAHQTGWVGLHLKVNRDYKGLSHVLHKERAKKFMNQKWCTLGTGAHENGIEQYKKELGPKKVVEYYYVLTSQ